MEGHIRIVVQKKRVSPPWGTAGLRGKEGSGEGSSGREDRGGGFVFVATLPRASADTDHSR